jgi:transcriptional regulator with XRE-family HTH domain
MVSMTTAAETKAREICSAIGQRIRLARREKGLSLEEMARKAGFAKSYLSQLENLKREPPISTLSQIAHVLGVDLLFLISGETPIPGRVNLAIVRKGERKTVRRPFGSLGYIYESMTYKKPDRLMEGYIITIGCEFPPEVHEHEGQELHYMLEGRLELLYDGQSYILEEGDCFYFDSNRPHVQRSVDVKPSKVLVVVTTKRDSAPYAAPTAVPAAQGVKRRVKR